MVGRCEDGTDLHAARSGTACRAPTEPNARRPAEIGAVRQFLFAIRWSAECFDHSEGDRINRGDCIASLFGVVIHED